MRNQGGAVNGCKPYVVEVWLHATLVRDVNSNLEVGGHLAAAVDFDNISVCPAAHHFGVVDHNLHVAEVDLRFIGCVLPDYEVVEGSVTAAAAHVSRPQSHSSTVLVGGVGSVWGMKSVLRQAVD